MSMNAQTKDRGGIEGEPSAEDPAQAVDYRTVEARPMLGRPRW